METLEACSCEAELCFLLSTNPLLCDTPAALLRYVEPMALEEVSRKG